MILKKCLRISILKGNELTLSELIIEAMEIEVVGLNYLLRNLSFIKSGIASPPGGLLVTDKVNDRY